MFFFTKRCRLVLNFFPQNRSRDYHFDFDNRACEEQLRMEHRRLRSLTECRVVRNRATLNQHFKMLCLPIFGPCIDFVFTSCRSRFLFLLSRITGFPDVVRASNFPFEFSRNALLIFCLHQLSSTLESHNFYENTRRVLVPR